MDLYRTILKIFKTRAYTKRDSLSWDGGSVYTMKTLSHEIHTSHFKFKMRPREAGRNIWAVEIVPEADIMHIESQVLSENDLILSTIFCANINQFKYSYITWLI